MYVIFDRSHDTVRNVQAQTRCRLTDVPSTVAVLSSGADAPLAVDSFSLTYVTGYARLTVSTNWYHTATLKQILACIETVLCTGTV